MLKIDNFEVVGWEHAIRGMRNPKNSHGKSDSGIECTMNKTGKCLNYDFINCDDCNSFKIGPNDHKLMMSLAKGGPVHAKYRRMITVYLDITAPLYWWKEFDTYKVGTVANSCSTMHKIHEKEFTIDDFSHEHILDDHDDILCPVEAGLYYEFRNDDPDKWVSFISPRIGIEIIINLLNSNRKAFLETKDKKYWWQMIQLLPTSYNQKRTVMLNYEVLHNIYHSRKNHKLDEWHTLCEWIESLPYSEIITCKEV